MDAPPLKLLIVDDEAIVCQTIAAMLKYFGHHAECAGDGIKGKAALTQTVYDAAFVDMRMPGLDGISLLKWTKENQPALPVIIMTGHGIEDAQKEAMKCGAHAFLKKPFSLKRLKDLINEIAMS